MNTPRSTRQVDFTLPLTREEAERIIALGPEAVIFVMLELSRRLAEQHKASPSPSTPSGMVPPYEKPAVRKRRRKPGAKPGHPGTRRQPPPEITRREEHPAPTHCEKCGTKLRKPIEWRYRLIEDIVHTQPEVTEHGIPRTWCPVCRTFVEPPVPDAMPRATVGHRMVALTAWLHYGLGVTISQILAVLNHHLRFTMSAGGLVSAWQRLADVLRTWYEEIAEQAKDSAVLHADETGWRVAGRTVWLWCFTSRLARATYYMIDRSRGSPALLKFFTESFAGVLVTDFWAAYNAVVCGARQACLAHLFRELEKTDQADPSPAWLSFSKKLRRLLHDAIRLRARQDLPAERLASRRSRLDKRLAALIETRSENRNVKRLIKRLRRYRDALFTFLDHRDVPSDNNHAEREIRPAVVMRKNSLCNRSENGARAQAILMSVYRTLKQRALDPLDTIVSALKDYVRTGTLPPLPS